MINGISGASLSSAALGREGLDGGLTIANKSVPDGAGNTPASHSGERSAAGPNNTDQMRLPHRQSGELSDAMRPQSDVPELKQLLEQLVELLSQLLQMLKTGSSSIQNQAAVTPDGGGPIRPEKGSSDGNIPKPTEHLKTFNLGGKQVTIGGDGTATAAEVQQTAQTLQRMYRTSPTFRQQIDNNPNQSLEISVGRRSDNTSWGASDGRIFLNINNETPTSNDRFESLVSHEVGHTQHMEHGQAMDRMSDSVAAEAA